MTAVRELRPRGEPFVYAYYEGIDKVAHAEGLGQYYDDELRAADRLVADVLEVLPPGAVLVVTADHGQVDVGALGRGARARDHGDVMLISGEGRFRWLHARPGAVADLAATAAALHGDVAWVRTKEQIIDEGWLGGIPSAEVAARLGDVALVPFEPIAFLDPADTGELRLRARHGSLTPAEMLVPLLAWRARERRGDGGNIGAGTRARTLDERWRRKAPWLTRRTTSAQASRPPTARRPSHPTRFSRAAPTTARRRSPPPNR